MTLAKIFCWTFWQRLLPSSAKDKNAIVYGVLAFVVLSFLVVLLILYFIVFSFPEPEVTTTEGNSDIDVTTKVLFFCVLKFIGICLCQFIGSFSILYFYYLTNGKSHAVRRTLLSYGCTREVAKHERSVRVDRGDTRGRL